MKFLHGNSDTISEPVFVALKYRFSVLSIVLTTAVVVALETRAMIRLTPCTSLLYAMASSATAA